MKNQLAKDLKKALAAVLVAATVFTFAAPAVSADAATGITTTSATKTVQIDTVGEVATGSSIALAAGNYAVVTTTGSAIADVSIASGASVKVIDSAKADQVAKTVTGSAITTASAVKVAAAFTTTTGTTVDYSFTGTAYGTATYYLVKYDNGQITPVETYNITVGTIAKKPAKVTKVSVKNVKGNKIKVTFKNLKSKAAGYKVYVYRGSKKIKTVTVTSSSKKSTLSKKISIAKKYRGKKLTVRVRAYNVSTLDDSVVNGKLSSKASVKFDRK